VKYLQVYDHNGNLTKEFPIYVDGEDFSWVADKPEAIWLGTIRLVSEPSAQTIEPTPEPEPEVLLLPHVGEVIALPPEPELESAEEADKQLYGENYKIETLGPEPVDEGELALDKIDAEARLEEIEEREDTIEAEQEAEIESQVPFTIPEPTTERQLESEVKHELKKRVHKGSRKSRVKPPASFEGTETVSD